jgi:integrase
MTRSRSATTEMARDLGLDNVVDHFTLIGDELDLLHAKSGSTRLRFAALRDRALLLLGFAVGLRRSELVALQVEDLSPSPDGLRIRIARSKTDQQGRDQELLVVYAEPPRPCPVRALRAWLDAAEVTTGPIFRRVTRTGAISNPLTPQTVALIIKKRPRTAGLDAREFAGHSLRSGYATQAARDGHHPTQIAATTRHQDQRVLAGYIRAGRGRDDIAPSSERTGDRVSPGWSCKCRRLRA